MHAPLRALLALLVATAAFAGGSASAAPADAATAADRFYRNCPKVTKRLYPKKPNLVSSHCRSGSYYERLRVAASSWAQAPDGTVTTSTTYSVITVKRGPAKPKP